MFSTGPQRRVGSWRVAIDELREENAALLECLEAAGLMSVETFKARLHRRRFAAARHAHPCQWTSTLMDVLAPIGVVLPVYAYAGLSAAHKLKFVSQSVLCTLGTISSALWGTCMKLYMCGGYNGRVSQSSLEDLDPMSRAWEMLLDRSEQRCFPAAAAISGRIYVCGGFDDEGVLNSAECLDLATRAWEELPPMLERRSYATAAAVEGRLYVCGGDAGGSYLSSAERFDPAEGVWEQLPRMNERRIRAAAASIAAGLYVCGGRAGAEALNSVERFDPARGVWKSLPPMDEQRVAAAVAVLVGRLYVCGGDNGMKVVNSAERFDPIRGMWELLPPMRERRMGAGAAAANATVATAGRGLLICGGDNGIHFLGSMECFDPATGTWALINAIPMGLSATE